MSVQDLHDIMGGVVYESGFILDNQQALRYLVEAVPIFNAHVSPGFTLSPGPGAEPTRPFLLDRPASAVERRVLTLYAVLLWLDGEARKASFAAIKHSNAAGSTAMDGIEFALSKRAKEIRDAVAGELTGLLDGLNAAANSAAVLAGAGHQELGESLPGTWWYGTFYPPPPPPYWGV